MKSRWSRWLTGVFVVVCLFVLYLYLAGYRYLVPGYHLFYFTPEKYKATLSRVDVKRKALAGAELPLQQRMFMEMITAEIFPYWYGTRWNFYGQTTVPGSGTIACGYFVTTVLKDMGMPLNRVALAQCASEQMINTLVQKKYIWHYNNMPLHEFVNGVKGRGPGIYIIGLDNHTGFIWVNNNRQVRFVHSSGRFPFCVINEEAAASKVLEKSSYKVVGKISADEQAMKKWVNNWN